MRIVITFFLISFILISFKMFPENRYYDFWLLYEKTKSLQNYVWHLSNNLAWFVIYLIIWSICKLVEPKTSGYILMFLIMQGLIFIEWALRYNEPWIPFYGGLYGLSHIFIIFKAIIVSHVIYYHGRKSRI